MYFIRDTAITVLPELFPGLVHIWTEVCLLLFTQITNCVPLGFFGSLLLDCQKKLSFLYCMILSSQLKMLFSECFPFLL